MLLMYRMVGVTKRKRDTDHVYGSWQMSEVWSGGWVGAQMGWQVGSVCVGCVCILFFFSLPSVCKCVWCVLVYVC